ncbi:MAG: hypothetical protein G01um101429_74 [Parcubacteria group bacterium Gr01-1014_29]|nr:MAG: hypothetical protein G01um101429_74 [Parcubacteria group bacterium Gr01-1014_29]
MFGFDKEKFQYIFDRYERWAFSGSMLLGFIVDSLTLTRIDLLFDNLVLFFYLAVAVVGIVITNLYDTGVWRGTPDGVRLLHRIPSYARMVSPFLMQYAFGGLLSGFFVFYSRGASFSASGLFLALLFGLLVGNEFFRTRYQQFTFQVSILFFVLYSYMIFFIPIVVGAMGAWVFLASGAVSIGGMGFLLYGFSCLMPTTRQQLRTAVAGSIGGIFLVMNALYFLNILPPLPLSLKEAEVYHEVRRVAGGYRVMGEDQPWYAFLLPRKTVHLIPGNPVYFYSAVFAPTRLAQTRIIHHWQYFDEKKDAWISRSRIEFPIAGGRDGGYRGYSQKTNVEPGLWRVRVETTRGQVLGQKSFWVERVAESPALVEQIF